jgi:hypothetical protein
MSQYLDPNILGLLMLVAAGIAAIALLSFYILPHLKKQPEDMGVATSDWQPTGKIDFHSPDLPKVDNVPATLFLQVEDYRTFESVSGVEHLQLRWRAATLAEAKSVVVATNAKEATVKTYHPPKLVPGGTAVEQVQVH